MSTTSQLIKQSIKAAKDQNWKLAVSLNLDLLDNNSGNLDALNRLGLAYMQLKKIPAAKKIFNKVLAKDKTNIIANKHLKKLKKQKNLKTHCFAKSYFIEEPGKTKIIELHRLTDKNKLNMLDVGQECKLVLKSRFISIETEDNEYIGALPEDISFRLTKLIKTGNEYCCHVHFQGDKQCRVLIKEIIKSPKNVDIQSFPLNKNSVHLAQTDNQYVPENNTHLPTVAVEKTTDISQALNI
jgi:hypothetical protein